MKGFQESHDVSEYLESSSSRLLNGGQQSTLWIGNTAETPDRSHYDSRNGGNTDAES